ncbi:hypothetical protein ACIQVK_53820, partial [Streptomyces sp. NPDC090493]
MAGRILEAHIGYEPGVYPEVGAVAPWLPGPVYMITVANFNSFSELVTVRDSRGVEFVLSAAQFSELVAGDPGLAAAGPAAKIVLAGPGLGGRYQGVPRSVASAARRVVWAYTSFMRVSDEGLLAPHDGDRSQVPAGRWARFDPGIPLDEGRRDLGYEMHPLVGAGGRVVGLTFLPPSELADSQYEHKALPLAKYSVRKGWDVIGSRDVPWPSAGVEYVLAHGEPGIASMHFNDGTEDGIDGRSFAELLLGRLRPGVKCVVLLSCHGASGPDPVAQQIANINNVVVFANNGKPTFHVPLDEEKGYTTKGFYVSIQDTREWVEFRPEPTGGRLSKLARIAGWPENVTLELVRILRRLLPVTLEDDEISFVSTLWAAGEAERFRVASFRVASLSGGAIAPLTADTMVAFLNSFTGWRSEHATYGVENLLNGARAYDSGSRWASYEVPDEPDEDPSRRTLSASRPPGVRPAESAGEAAGATAPVLAGEPVPGEWAQPAPPQETAPQPELTPSSWFNALLGPDLGGQDPEVWGGEGAEGAGAGAVQAAGPGVSLDELMQRAGDEMWRTERGPEREGDVRLVPSRRGGSNPFAPVTRSIEAPVDFFADGRLTEEIPLVQRSSQDRQEREGVASYLARDALPGVLSMGGRATGWPAGPSGARAGAGERAVREGWARDLFGLGGHGRVTEGHLAELEKEVVRAGNAGRAGSIAAVRAFRFERLRGALLAEETLFHTPAQRETGRNWAGPEVSAKLSTLVLGQVINLGSDFSRPLWAGKRVFPVAADFDVAIGMVTALDGWGDEHRLSFGELAALLAGDAELQRRHRPGDALLFTGSFMGRATAGLHEVARLLQADVFANTGKMIIREPPLQARRTGAYLRQWAEVYRKPADWAAGAWLRVESGVSVGPEVRDDWAIVIPGREGDPIGLTFRPEGEWDQAVIRGYYSLYRLGYNLVSPAQGSDSVSVVKKKWSAIASGERLFFVDAVVDRGYVRLGGGSERLSGEEFAREVAAWLRGFAEKPVVVLTFGHANELPEGGDLLKDVSLARALATKLGRDVIVPAGDASWEQASRAGRLTLRQSEGGEGGELVRVVPEPSGQALARLAERAGVSDEVSARQMERLLRSLFGATLEDRSDYLSLVRAAGVLFDLRQGVGLADGMKDLSHFVSNSVPGLLAFVPDDIRDAFRLVL